MSNKTTITTAGPHSIQPGHTISIDERDRRWWRRLWHFVLRRQPPYRTVYYKVTSVSKDTITVSKPAHGRFTV